MDDIINQPQAPQQDAPQSPKPRRWLRSLLVGLLLFFVVCAGLFFWFVRNTRSQPPYSTALQLIQNDPQLLESLGKPIRDLRWLPTSGYPEQFQMQVEGPKGLADISVRAGKFEGRWEVTAVDALVREGSRRFSLDTGQGTDDAPTWSPGATTTPGAGGDEVGLEPPAGIDVELPGGGPPGVEINLPELPPDMNIEMPSVPPAPES